MKKLLGIVVLNLFLISTTQADDIRDFQIVGMSIGDSALDYFSEEVLKKNQNRRTYPKSNKYYGISIVKKINDYDGIKFTVKEGDKKYILVSLEGRIHFEETNKCKKKKKEIVNKISSSLTINERNDYEFEYPQYIKSKAFITDLNINGGKIRVWCDDLSKETIEEMNLIKSLAVSIQSDIFSKWLREEAY